MTEAISPQPTSGATDHQVGPIQTTAVGRWGVVLRLVLAFVSGLVVYGPALLLLKLPGMDGKADALAGNWTLVLLKLGLPIATIPLAAVGVIWLLNRFVDHRPFTVSGIRFDRRSFPALLVGTAISLIVIVPAAVVLGRLGVGEVAEITSHEPLWAATIYTLILGFLMQGSTEEFIWRGWLSQSVGGSWRRQAIITSIGFGLIHILSNGGHDSFGEGALYVLNAAAFGFAAATLYFATGSIWAAVGVHGGLHLANFLAVLLGGALGWQLNLVTLVLYGLVGVIVMRRLPGRGQDDAAPGYAR